MIATPRLRFTGAFAALMLFALVMPAHAQTARELALIQRLGKQAEEAKTNTKSLAETLAAAKTIDEYMAAVWKDKKATATKGINDQVFLRRIYLDIAGRIPTLEETLAFYRNASPNKRSKLIDDLLNSEAYTSNMFNFWADLMRVQSNMNGNGNEYARWIKNVVRTNMPYDKMVYELVTAEGYTWENGAAGFYLRDSGMPLDNMSTTVQIFLGTSIVCAQCHDHPFDNWSQFEFYEMAAYTYGQNTRFRPKNVEEASAMLSGEEEKDALNDLTRVLGYKTTWTDSRDIALPENYKYDDAKPGQMVKPYTIFGDQAKFGNGVTRREAYAKWMTSPSNPRFTMVIANRMWNKVFNRGLFEPIDEIMDDTEPLDRGLLDYLSHKMVQYDYDIKQFLRVLYNTQAYQREITVATLDPDEPYLFTGSVLRRMSAEQIWDSMVAMSIPDPDHHFRNGAPRQRYDYSDVELLQHMEPKELAAYAKEYSKGRVAKAEIQTKIRDLRKANMNGNKNAIMALQKQMDAIKMPNIRDFVSTAKSAEKEKDDYEMTKNQQLMADNAEMLKDTKVDQSKYNGFVDMYRASELTSPEGPTHMLRLFGQSDRDVVNNANREPNLVQVLAMFNGGLFDTITSDKSLMMQNVEKVSDPSEKVQVIFLSMLNRKASSREMKLVEPFARKNDYKSIVWAIMNMREFSFVQ
ncbi:MAG: DUF1549 domain-containing protein [Phycisphaera sp.]|nr:DUF1549 domain-containing protein [Phycisphaera sp.]